MNARRFFFVAAGILLLVVAYAIGASRVTAQTGNQFVGIAADISQRTTLAITTNGDVYGRQGDVQCGFGPNGLGFVAQAGCPSGWVYIGNVLGTPSDAQPPAPPTWSKVKGDYRR